MERAEEVEQQWNSQLARRFVVALPREVPLEMCLQMMQEYCQEHFVSKGMCCDFAIHDPDPPGHNPHCPIMLTMRAMDEIGKWMPKSHKVYDLDENGERIRLPPGNWKSHKEDTVNWNEQYHAEEWRHGWDLVQNKYLELARSPERMDMRSYERQGLDKIPTVHMGAAICALERKGIETNIILEKLKKKGTTVVLIEHRLYYVKSLFDCFLLVKDGEIAQDSSREEVIHLEGEFLDENGLRTLELEEYIISDRKDSYQLNDESISGKSLRFCYPNVAKDGKKQNKYILNHLDFNMECGKVIGIIGLNGTGKTTFARVISGLEKIKEGKIWAEKDKELNRKDLMDMSYFVFQDSDYQLFSESVLDEMLLGISSKDKKENTQKAKFILNVLGLYKYVDKHPFALSRGEKQRLTIACGMMKKAKVFIYDEPTSGCDKDLMLSVAKLIEEQLKIGTTVLVISHDFEFLVNTVSKLWVMGDGKIETVLDISESNKFLILDKMRGGSKLGR